MREEKCVVRVCVCKRESACERECVLVVECVCTKENEYAFVYVCMCEGEQFFIDVDSGTDFLAAKMTKFELENNNKSH